MALRTMSGKLPIMGSARASLKELATGEVYKIEWSPALIGRPTPDNADTLAVDLSKYAVAQSISRNHAEIIELDGSYFLESKSTTSKTALNGSDLRRGERRLLQSEDKITCGQITLVFFVD
jgi:pSer/pThr/pTyr-binding forkhead associated (FHA) protein